MDETAKAKPTASSAEPDPHGQAALLLIESLIHELAAQDVLPWPRALAIVEIAQDTQQALIDDAVQTTSTMRKVGALLAAIAASLRTNLPRGDVQ